jgi:hypothetical protein
MRVWLILFIALLSVESAAGAAFTSTQTGNWSATSTWGNAGPPGNGDTATIATGTVVTVDVDTTVGTSGVTGTAAISLQNNGQIIIAANHLLRTRGDIIATGNFGGGTTAMKMNPGATLEFDSSQAVSPSTTKYVFGESGDSFLTYLDSSACTTGNHCSVRSNAGGANGRFSMSGFSDGGGEVWAYTDFLRIGDAGNAGATPGFSSGLIPWDAQHCTFTNGGAMPGTISGGTARQYDIVRHKNNVHAGTLTTYSAFFNFLNAITTGDRTITNNVFDKIFANDGIGSGAMIGATINDNVFMELAFWSGGGAWSSSQRNLMRLDTTGGFNPIIIGDSLDNYWLTDTYTQTHVHTPNIDCSITTAQVLRNIFESTYFASDPIAVNDGIVECVGSDILTALAVKNNIVLPTGDGTYGSQALIDMLGIHHVIYDIEHNTINCPRGAGCTMMEYEDQELPNGVASRGTLANNIFWAVSNLATNFAANLDLENPITDYFAPANVKNNSRYNVANTNPSAPHAPANQGNSYIGAWSVTPGGSDVNGNPNFVDSTRNLATFDGTYLKNVAGSTWLSGHAYSVGDIVSDHNPSYYGNTVINYRCLSPHTSSGGNEPGATSNFVWEFASLNSIRNAVAASLTITDATIGASSDTYIVALEKWVRAGFAPKNQALKAAGSDGLDIGAVSVATSGAAGAASTAIPSPPL